MNHTTDLGERAPTRSALAHQTSTKWHTGRSASDIDGLATMDRPLPQLGGV
jgi:hypothetical protein